MARREIAGIVLVSLVVGLVVVGLLAGRRSEEDLSLISHTVPGSFMRSVGSRPVLSIGLVLGRDMADLGLGFSVLVETDPGPWVRGAGSWLREEELRPGRTGLLPVDLWLDRAAAFGIEVSPHVVQATVNGTLYDAHFYDFRDVPSSSGPTSVFAVLFEDGNLSKVHWGYSDFFIAREETVISLKVELGEGAEVYSDDPAIGDEPGASLPRNGRLVLRNVLEDDQILVTMTLEGHQIPEGGSWLWACLPRVDGEYADPWVFPTL
jgi:hypothetical protein